MKITFATPALHQVFISQPIAFNAITKLKQDLVGGLKPGTPGPDILKYNGMPVPAKHFHLTNRIGLAYYGTDTEAIILALGEKHNRNKGRGDSGYDWDDKGSVNF